MNKLYYLAVPALFLLFKKGLGVSALSYPDLVNKYYDKVRTLNQSFVPDSLVLAMIFTESAGDPTAVGDGGKSLGLMQIQAAAWQDSAAPYEYNKFNAFNAEKNIIAGTGYLQFLGRSTGYDIDNSIMAYNVGYGNLTSGDQKWQTRAENYLRTVRKHYKKIIPYLIGS